MATWRKEHAEKEIASHSSWGRVEGNDEGESRGRWDSVVEKGWRDMGGNQDEILFIHAHAKRQ